MSRLPQDRTPVKPWLKIAPALLVIGAVALADYAGLFEVADGGLLDSQFRLLRSTNPVVVDSDVVVIAIDEATLKASQTPLALWHAHYGQLFERLATAQPRAVGFDIVLPARGYESQFPDTDHALLRGLQALQAADIPVVVAHSIDEQRRPKPIYAPFLAFVDPQYGIGSDVLRPDADRVIRRHTEDLGRDGQHIATFAGQVVRVSGGRYRQGLLNHRLIQDIPILSAGRFFNASPRARAALRADLKDKVVIIGSVLSDIDRLALPLPLLHRESASRQPGVIVQANVISALLNDTLLPEPHRGGFMLLLMLSLLLWPLSTTVLRAGGGLAVYLLGVYGLALGLLVQGAYVPIAAAMSSAFLLTVMRLLIRTYQVQRAVLITKTRVEAQREFVDAVSHDLRTPVGAILSTVDLVTRAKDDQARGQYLAWLAQAATVLEEEVEELLALSKIEDAAYQPAAVTFDLYALMTALYASILPLAAAKHLAVRLSISADVAPIRHAPQTAVTRVLQNLLANALKYTAQGTIAIRVLSARDDQSVQIDVQDEGGGIPDDKIPRLFDKYQRLTDEAPGVGLGMAIVRKLVDTLQGTISIESTEGQGTTIRISLPLEEATDPKAEESAFPPVTVTTRSKAVARAFEHPELTHQTRATGPTPQQRVAVTDDAPKPDDTLRIIQVLADQSSRTGNSDAVWGFGQGATISSQVSGETVMRLLHLAALDFGLTVGAPPQTAPLNPEVMQHSRNLLLVDDNEIVRMAWTALLSKAGYHVVTAANGAEALESLRETRFDAVILDQNMPDIPGTELAKSIRAQADIEPQLLLFLATAESLEAINAAPGVITDYVSKTIAPDDLLKKLEHAIQKREDNQVNARADSG